MQKQEYAAGCFSGGFNCAQAVFTAFSGDLGLEPQSALRVACGFGGGMGHTGSTCGAVSGAVMAIGLKHGKCRPEDNDAKAKTYELVAEFCKRFKEKHGSLLCTELLGHDLTLPDGAKVARETGAFQTVCPRLIGDAVGIAEEIVQRV